MVVVRFLLEFSDGTVLTIPVGLSDARSPDPFPPLKNYIARLKEKCRIKSAVELRYSKSAKPVDAAEWSPFKEDGDFLMGIVYEPPSEAALEYRENAVRAFRSNSIAGGAKPALSVSQQQGIDVVTSAATTTTTTTPGQPGVVTIDPTKKKQTNNGSRVEVLDDESQPAAAAAAAASSSSSAAHRAASAEHGPSDEEDDDEYDPRGGEHVPAEDAVHFIQHSNTGHFSTVSRVAAAGIGAVLYTEPPQLSPMYPSSLVDLVRRDAHMKYWIRQIDAGSAQAGRVVERMESALHGLTGEDYALHLYAAKRRGHVLPAKKDEECDVAFYSVTDCVSHSCAPSAFTRFKQIKVRGEAVGEEEAGTDEKQNNDHDGDGDDDDDGDKRSSVTATTNKTSVSKKKRFQVQQIAVVRCARPSGITAGDFLTIALPRVAVMDFFLLPTARRKRYLMEQYLLKEECACERCQGRVAEGQSAVEVSLTGAYFEGPCSSREQTFLTVAMKKAFDELKIMAPSNGGSEPLVLSVEARAGRIPAERVPRLYDFVRQYTHNLHLPAHLLKKEEQQQKQQAAAAAAAATANTEDGATQTEAEGAAAASAPPGTAKLLLHPNHWRLSMARMALLAFLLPPDRCAAVLSAKAASTNCTGDELRKAGVPTKHASVKLDQLVVRMLLTQLNVESGVLAKYARCAHPCLKRSYLLLRAVLALLPEKLAVDVQRQARELPCVDWALLEAVAAI